MGRKAGGSTAVVGGQWSVVGGQWSVAGGQERQGRWGRTSGRLGTRRHGGTTARSLTHKLRTRAHGGIATRGGVAGGVPPHKGGPERPTAVVSGQ